VLPWVGVWAVLLALHCCIPAVTWDETWFAQVTERVAHQGAVPYRDVFFTATPLSMYIGVAASALIGTQLLVLRAIAAAYAVVAAAAGWSVAGRLGLGRVGQISLTAALLGLGSGLGSPPSHYTALAIAGAAVVFDLAIAIALAPTDSETRRLAMAAAAAVAVTFGAKQNIGVYIAPMPVVALLTRRPRPADLAGTLGRAAAIGATVVGFVLAPVVLTGGVSAFVDQAVASPGDFSPGAIPWSDGLDVLGHDVTHITDPGRWPAIVQGSAFVLPAVAVILLLLAFFGGAYRDRQIAVLALLGGAAISAHALPRSDGTHVVAASVGSMLAIGVAASLLRTRVAFPPVRLMFASLGGVAFVVLAAGAMSQVYVGNRNLPHARGLGVPLRPGELDAIAKVRDATGGTVFVYSPDASHIYLYGGLRNPTPYDFPIRTALGRSGEADLAAAVRAGRLPLCLGFSYGPPMAPVELDDAVRESLTPVLDAQPVCVLEVPISGQ